MSFCRLEEMGLVPVSHAAQELYGDDIIKYVEILAKEGTPTAVRHKLWLIVSWLAAGRSSESSYLRWDTFCYDEHFHAGACRC